MVKKRELELPRPMVKVLGWNGVFASGEGGGSVIRANKVFPH